MHQREDGLPTIGLAMIVKNEAQTLPKLFASLGMKEIGGEGEGSWFPDAAVDFAVICDTGSTDDTKKVAASYGCKVIDFAWCDDFSKARQASYDALPDVAFTLWADGDDVLVGAEKLHELAARMPPEVAAFIAKYNYAQDVAGNCCCELWRERLVRRGIGEAWQLPIHEVLAVPGQMVHIGEVEWVHIQPEGRERDPERNYKILKRDYEESKAKDEAPNPRTLAYLGTEALALGRADEAVQRFDEYLSAPNATWDQERCQVAHKMSIALRQLERWQDAEAAALLAITERTDWADGYLDLAECALHAGNPERALQRLDVIDRLTPPQTLLIINPLEYTYQPTLMRSVALAQLGRMEESWEMTQKVLAITPYREDLQRQAATIAVHLKGMEAEKHLLALRELLVRHDENGKAAELMARCVPYFVESRPAVAQAKLDQREMTLHASDPETYAEYYGENPNETPFEAQGIEIEKAHEVFHRLKFLRQTIKEQASKGTPEGTSNGTKSAPKSWRHLDLAANDFWMLANLWSGQEDMGVQFTELSGMDLNTGAVERGKARQEKYGWEGKAICADLHTAPEHFEPHSFDTVSAFELIEHVPDPRAMLAVMCKMCKPDGQILVSTPDGAYEQGNVPGWFRVEHKGHLRAIRPSELSAWLCELGIVEDVALEQRLIVAAVKPQERKGKIVFFAGAAEAVPEKIMMEGLGGSETALCKMAEHFARRGYDVRVYAGQGGGLRGDHLSVGEDLHTGGQVLYRPATEWDPGEDADLFVSSRLPEVFDRSIRAKRRLLWLHDADYGDRITPERIERTTDVAVMSQFQHDLLAKRYPCLADKLWITRNGIETSWFADLPSGRKPWVVYSSSPDRGLDVLLECWPEIRKRAIEQGVRKPELHTTYAPVYSAFKALYPHLQAFHARLDKLMEGQEGIVAHTSMGQKELADLYLQSKVWSYPSWTGWSDGGSIARGAAFPEISCIAAAEAQAAGCIPVFTDYAALKETVVAGERIELDEADGRLTDAWREQFINGVVRGLTDAEWGKQVRREGRAHALTLDWAGVCDSWEDQLLDVAREQEAQAVAA